MTWMEKVRGGGAAGETGVFANISANPVIMP